MTNARGILFKEDMIKAILDGRKTMTRRIMKVQPIRKGYGGFEVPNDAPKAWQNSDDIHTLCPYGKPGDYLYVKEGWCYKVDENGYTHFDQYLYRSDDPNIRCVDGDGFQVYRKNGAEASPWKSPLFMPKSATRIWLRITDIRVERLQDITPHDACEEGVEYWDVDMEAFHGGEFVADFKNYMWRDDESYEDFNFPSFANSVDSFRTLWQSIHGRESWYENKWVWVYTFERCEKHSLCQS